MVLFLCILSDHKTSLSVINQCSSLSLLSLSQFFFLPFPSLPCAKLTTMGMLQHETLFCTLPTFTRIKLKIYFELFPYHREKRRVLLPRFRPSCTHEACGPFLLHSSLSFVCPFHDPRAEERHHLSPLFSHLTGLWRHAFTHLPHLPSHLQALCCHHAMPACHPPAIWVSSPSYQIQL